MPLHWISAALRERDVKMRDFLFYCSSEMASESRPSIRWVANRPALVIPPNLLYLMTAFGDIQQSESESVVWLDRIRQRKGVKLYLLMSRAGALELFELRVGASTF